MSGWEHVLPRQGFPLTMLVGTACQPGFTASLDDCLREVFGGYWDMICGDFDGALTFSWPDEEWDYEAAPEGREACEAARWEQFSAVLTTAGFLVPATVRDLSELYLTWGPARREETPDGTRWSIPAALPLPDDLLRLDPVLTERLDGIRRAMRTGPFLGTLIDQLVDDFTSLDRLAAATGQDRRRRPARSRGMSAAGDGGRARHRGGVAKRAWSCSAATVPRASLPPRPARARGCWCQWATLKWAAVSDGPRRVAGPGPARSAPAPHLLCARAAPVVTPGPYSPSYDTAGSVRHIHRWHGRKERRPLRSQEAP